MVRGSLARASLARPSMTRSQFGVFLFGTCHSDAFLIFAPMLIQFAILFLPVWRELLWRVFCVYVSFKCRIVCIVSLLMLSKCRRGYIMANMEISKVFFCGWSILLLIRA